jgi:hypothetical protein
VRWDAWLSKLAATRLVRRAVETVFRTSARGRLVELDHQPPARSQERILLGLVHRAQSTRFGRVHDFRRISTYRDFQRLVPLRKIQEFSQQDGEEQGVSYGSLPRELERAYRQAGLTALGLVVSARPKQLFGGRMVALDTPEVGGPLPLFTHLPWPLKPYLEILDGESLWHVSQINKPPLTLLAGRADALENLLSQSQGASARQLWSRLSAVIYTQGKRPVPRPRLARLLGDNNVMLMEAFTHSVGVLAIEDPHHGLPRLLVDHGLFFELVPLDELSQPSPARMTIGDAEPGVSYALAVSSPAGVWACLTGQRISFESLNPPLVRLTSEPLRPPVFEPAAEQPVAAPQPPPPVHEQVVNPAPALRR